MQNNPNLLNNIGGGSGVNPNLTTLSNMQPLQAQKYLNQGLHAAAGGAGGGVGGVGGNGIGGSVAGGIGAGVGGTGVGLPNFNTLNQATMLNQIGGNNGSGSQPSTQQLRMLVQQIQMAVQAGYLNHQILNQPLAPTTLLLLNQLLTHIKVNFVIIIINNLFFILKLYNN